MKRLAPVAALAVLVALLIWLAVGAEPDSNSEPMRLSTVPAAELETVRSDGETPGVSSVATAMPELTAAGPKVLEPLLIRGVVVRAADGTPLEDVRVIPILAEPPDGSSRLSAARTRDGRFEFGPDVVAQGVRALGLVWTEMQTARSFDAHLNQPTGREVAQAFVLAESATPIDQLRLVLDTGWTARGRVVDSAGQPVGRIFVESDYPAHGASTAVDGTFTLRDFPWSAVSIGLHVHPKGWSEARVLLSPPQLPLRESSIEITIVRQR